MLLIDNPKYTTQYFSITENRFMDMTQSFSKTLFTPESYAAHIENETTLPIHLNEYKPVLPGIYPIPARTKWSYEDGIFTKLKKNIKLSDRLTFDSCLRNTDRLLKNAKGKIAVELSGGLDSTLMICAMERLGYEPLLIGTVSKLYKFRTERRIQESIARRFKNVILTESFAKQFTNLLNTPAHFLPCFISLQYNISANSLEILKGHNIQYVLQGTAFDCMLVEEIKGAPNQLRWPTLQDNWLHDYVFAPQGTSYVDVAALTPYWHMFSSLRGGEGKDIQKWWARRFFADLLPSELSQYAYKANFGPQWWDGLLSSSEDILYIVNMAHQITSLPAFENFSMKSIFDGMNNGAGRLGFAKLAYANWVHSLYKAGRITD